MKYSLGYCTQILSSLRTTSNALLKYWVNTLSTTRVPRDGGTIAGVPEVLVPPRRFGANIGGGEGFFCRYESSFAVGSVTNDCACFFVHSRLSPSYCTRFCETHRRHEFACVQCGEAVMPGRRTCAVHAHLEDDFHRLRDRNSYVARRRALAEGPVPEVRVRTAFIFFFMFVHA